MKRKSATQRKVRGIRPATRKSVKGSLVARQSLATASAFMRLAADDPVAAAVIDAVAAAANYPAAKIQRGYELQGQPLGLDSPGLRYLSKLLTNYVRQTRPGESVTLAEVSAPGLTAGGLIELVKGKLT